MISCAPWASYSLEGDSGYRPVQQERESTFSRRRGRRCRLTGIGGSAASGLPVQAVKDMRGIAPPTNGSGNLERGCRGLKPTRDTYFPAPYPSCSGLPKDEKVP
jgi:hypothetical protein